MNLVYVEGEGAIDEHGRFWPEANLRAGVAALADVVAFFKSLPEMTQQEIEDAMAEDDEE